MSLTIRTETVAQTEHLLKKRTERLLKYAALNPQSSSGSSQEVSSQDVSAGESSKQTRARQQEREREERADNLIQMWTRGKDENAADRTDMLLKQALEVRPSIEQDMYELAEERLADIEKLMPKRASACTPSELGEQRLANLEKEMLDMKSEEERMHDWAALRTQLLVRKGMAVSDDEDIGSTESDEIRWQDQVGHERHEDIMNLLQKDSAEAEAKVERLFQKHDLGQLAGDVSDLSSESEEGREARTEDLFRLHQDEEQRIHQMHERRTNRLVAELEADQEYWRRAEIGGVVTRIPQDDMQMSNSEEERLQQKAQERGALITDLMKAREAKAERRANRVLKRALKDESDSSLSDSSSQAAGSTSSASSSTSLGSGKEFGSPEDRLGRILSKHQKALRRHGQIRAIEGEEQEQEARLTCSSGAIADDEKGSRLVDSDLEGQQKYTLHIQAKQEQEQQVRLSGSSGAIVEEENGRRSDGSDLDGQQKYTAQIETKQEQEQQIRLSVFSGAIADDEKGSRLDDSESGSSGAIAEYENASRSDDSDLEGQQKSIVQKETEQGQEQQVPLSASLSGSSGAITKDENVNRLDDRYLQGQQKHIVQRHSNIGADALEAQKEKAERVSSESYTSTKPAADEEESAIDEDEEIDMQVTIKRATGIHPYHLELPSSYCLCEVIPHSKYAACHFRTDCKERTRNPQWNHVGKFALHLVDLHDGHHLHGLRFSVYDDRDVMHSYCIGRAELWRQRFYPSGSFEGNIPLHHGAIAAGVLSIKIELGDHQEERAVEEETEPRLQEGAVYPVFVTMVEANGLQKVDPFGSFNSRCECKVGKCHKAALQTPVAKGTSSPRWDYAGKVLQYHVGQALNFGVVDADTGHPLGSAHLGCNKFLDDFRPMGFAGTLRLRDTVHSAVAWLRVKVYVPPSSGSIGKSIAQAQDPAKYHETVPKHISSRPYLYDEPSRSYESRPMPVLIAVCGCTDGLVQVYDLKAESQIGTLRGHHGSVTVLRADTANMLAISGAADGNLRLWDLVHLQSRGILRKHTGPITDVGVDFSTSRAVSVAEDWQVCSWDLDTLTCLSAFLVSDAVITSLSADFTAHRMLTGSQDGKLCLWQLADQVCKGGFHGHDCAITTLAANFPIERAMSGAVDGSFRVWDIPSAICLGSFAITSDLSSSVTSTMHVDFWSRQALVCYGARGYLLDMSDTEALRCKYELSGSKKRICGVSGDFSTRCAVIACQGGSLWVWKWDDANGASASVKLQNNDVSVGFSTMSAGYAMPGMPPRTPWYPPGA